MTLKYKRNLTLSLNVTDLRSDVARLQILESAVVHAQDAVVILESDPSSGPGRSVLYANPAFFRMSGYSPDEVIGRSLHYLRGPDSDPATLVQLRDALDAGELFKGDLLNYRKDGSTFWVELIVVPVFDDNNKRSHWVMIQRDIGDRKRAETERQQLLQAQKMELIGQMAGGIAHDFNNLLTGIIGNLALTTLDLDDPNRHHVNTALKAASRAADLTKKLLGFARKNQLLLSPILIGDVVSEVIGLISRTFDPLIQVNVVIQTTDRISADLTLLSQVLLNLCMNARDAMPHGGEIRIQARNVNVPAPGPHPDSKAGEFVMLSVEDNGTGMTPEVQAKIFEPFFTTKPIGQGTGLGLPMVQGILTQHQGWIEFESTPGVGTKFQMYLPKIEESVRRKSITPLRNPGLSTERRISDFTPAPVGTRQKRILLVDDEEIIRDLASHILKSDGHYVIEAEDGEVALKIFRNEYPIIDLVILDMNMPKMSGMDTFRAMREIDPTARVLLSSGYSHDDLSGMDGIQGLLPKPYRPAELISCVRQTLASIC